MTKLFLDTEFTSLRYHTSLNTIGLVAKSGAEFYRECTDYDQTLVKERSPYPYHQTGCKQSLMKLLYFMQYHRHSSTCKADGYFPAIVLYILIISALNFADSSNTGLCPDLSYFINSLYGA